MGLDLALSPGVRAHRSFCYCIMGWQEEGCNVVVNCKIYGRVMGFSDVPVIRCHHGQALDARMLVGIDYRVL